MREQLARALAVLTGLLILLAVVGFGAFQNRPESGGAPPPDAGAIASGKAVYEAQGCALCHAIAGEGEPQYPLDGIGSRLDAPQLRVRIAPDAGMKAAFPEAVFDMKQVYHEIPAADMDALVSYLRSLR